MTTKGYIQTRVQNSDDLDNIADWQNLINTIARHRELFTVSELEGMMAVIDHNVCDDLRPLLCKKYRSLNGFHLEECDCSESRVFLRRPTKMSHQRISRMSHILSTNLNL